MRVCCAAVHRGAARRRWSESCLGTGALLQRRRLLFGLAAAMAVEARADEDLANIRIVSDQWQGLTRVDGSGLYFDLIRAVYAQCGITVYTRTYPYARGVYMVQQARADAWVGSFWRERDFPIYPAWPFDRNRQMVLSRNVAGRQYQGQVSLRGRRVAWLRGFNMGRYVAQPMRVTEVDTVQSGLRMLDSERIDFLICPETALREALGPAPALSQRLRMDHLMDLGLYLAFAPSPRGQRLCDAWDRVMPSFHGSAAFRALFRRAHYPYPY